MHCGSWAVRGRKHASVDVQCIVQELESVCDVCDVTHIVVDSIAIVRGVALIAWSVVRGVVWCVVVAPR